MGRLKLRGLGADPRRLGELLAKAKQEIASEAEEIELMELLKAVQSASAANTRTLVALRADGDGAPKHRKLRSRA